MDDPQDLPVSLSEEDDGDQEEDLYGDLEVLGKNAEIARLTQQLEETDKEKNELKSELSALREQMSVLVQERAVLEQNMSKLYNTAIREIQRKDRDIAQLRDQVIKHNIAKAKGETPSQST